MPIHFNLDKYPADTYIETGLGQLDGPGSIGKALNGAFNSLHSIEIAKPLYKKGLKTLKEEISSGRLHIHHGDSINILPLILKKISHPCVFFLDSHGGYGGGSGVGEKPCPIMEELDIIAAHSIKDHIILIDDLRILNANAFNTNGINEEKIRKKILSINSSYTFSYEDGHVPNDVLAATA